MRWNLFKKHEPTTNPSPKNQKGLVDSFFTSPWALLGVAAFNIGAAIYVYPTWSSAFNFLVGGWFIAEALNLVLRRADQGLIEAQQALIKTQDEIIEQCAKNQEQFRGLLEHLPEQGTVELTVEKIESPTKSKSVH